MPFIAKFIRFFPA